MPITLVGGNIRTVYLVAGSVIGKDGKYLLVQEVKEHVRGLWNLPGGKVEKGLTLEENAIKEAKEETGFDVEIIREIGVYHEENDKSIAHAFEAKIIGGKLEFPKDEIMDVKWFDFDEIVTLERQNKIRTSRVIKAVREARNKLSGEK